MDCTALTRLGEIRAVIEALPSETAALFLDDWPAPVVSRTVAPATLPVLRWLRQAATDAPGGVLARLSQSVCESATTLAWRQTYRSGEMSPAFLDRYGWVEVFGLKGPVAAERIAGGLLLLGPETLYPPHAHAAEELYVPLSGTAEWQAGDSDFERRDPGSAIWHGSGVPHAMRTAAAPMLALYLWRGQGLGESARVVAAGGEANPP